MLRKLTYFSLDHPRLVILLTLIITLFFALQFLKMKIDTDPENMLEADQADRLFYNQVKKDFGIHDLLVLGITDEGGILRPETLAKVARITAEALKIKGVIIEDAVGLAVSDNVEAEDGTLVVRRFLSSVPQTAEEVERLKEDLYGNPLYVEKIISTDGKVTALYIPVQEKAMSYRISREIEGIVKKELGPGQSYYLAGLPVAEDTFGYEMFIQMAVTAPVTFLFIFLLMLFLFRRASLLVAPMLLAMVSVIWTMGAMIGLGYTVHIMSSMTPIFLMPIAVLDSVHLLSWFYDRYPALKDKRQTLVGMVEDLWTPCLYTSLTSAAGFASLMLAPIPPVQVHGGNVAFGIMVAWLLTFTFLPASIMLLDEEKLARRLAPSKEGGAWHESFLPALGRFAFARSPWVVAAGALLIALGIWGITRIAVNDNPVRWFKPYHRIRIADRVLNRYLGGTYTAYLVAEGEEADAIKRPEVMGYLSRLQEELEKDPLVGKTSSVADIVKRVNYVLHGEEKTYDAVPESREEIGQYLFLFSMVGDPNDLNNFLDYEDRKANIWVQMKGGDNRDMAEVEARVEAFTQAHPIPQGVRLRWSGLTYINKVWQGLMVVGMLRAVLGSFAVVFILMVLLFRSLGLGLISMLPLSCAIISSYGILGFIGKDYDMPIAVCSTLSLGLSIDFAIHFLQKFKSKWADLRNLEETNRFIFGETARAIWRNAIIITLAFLPLLFATLTPYVTVGAFFASLMIFSALSTLILLPGLVRLVGQRILQEG